MSAILRALAVTVLLALPACTEPIRADPAPAGAALDLVLPPGVVAELAVRADVAPAAGAFDIDPEGLACLAEGTRLKAFGSGQSLIDLGALAIDDFAFMRDDRLLFVTQNHLAGLSAKGVVLGPSLPAAGMRVRPAGVDTAYVFGGKATDVYLFARDGRVAKLASLPAPPAAVEGDGRVTDIVVERTILRVAEGAPARLLFEAEAPIVSLAAGPGDGVFYATASRVGFVGPDGNAVDFLRGDGGVLRARGERLFVLLSGGTLLRLGPLAPFAQALPPLGDAEPVKDLARLGEIKDRLYELNFDPGPVETAFDARAGNALREFERMRGLAETGVPTWGLLRGCARPARRDPGVPSCSRATAAPGA